MVETVSKHPIAIVGMGCVLPDAPDVDTFWNNLQTGKNSIREVPHDRWDPTRYWSPDKAADKTYAKIGGFVLDDNFNGLEYRMPPNMVQQVDNAQRWALSATRQAMKDAGYATGIRGDEGREFDRDRCAVILGNAMGGETNKIATKRLFWPDAEAAIREDPDFQALPAEQQDAILKRAEERYKSTTVPVTEDTMPGHLSNVFAGRIANVFDLGGKNFTTDAACASSLAALDAAMDALRGEEVDMVVWGGADRSMDVTPYIQFSAIGALSPDGSRPFDKDANGFVMGEGCAMFLLKRLEDAERDGDTIYGVVRGIGGSSDGKGKGITAPNPKGQVKAVRRAYQDAECNPYTIGYLEAHGTSTPVGDPVELTSVVDAFQDLSDNAVAPGTIRVGSVKSNIGHLKAGAGAAGVLKAVLALHHKHIPPSINVKELNPRIEWGTSPFQVATTGQEWPAGGTPRRAAVSSFGFGGTNFHVVLEEHVPGALQVRKAQPQAQATTPSGPMFDQPAFQAHMQTHAHLEAQGLVLDAATAPQFVASLPATVAFPETGEGPRLRDLFYAPTQAGIVAQQRVGIAPATLDELPKKLDLARKAATNPAAAKLAFQQGVFINQGQPNGKLAFLFPGQGTQYVNMGRDLAEKYAVVKHTFEEADEVLFDELDGVKLTDILWPTPNTPENQKASNEKLKLTEFTQPAVLAMDVAILRLLKQWNIQPDVVAGHSLGEYGALVAAGVLSFADALHAVAARGREMAGVDLPDLGKMASIPADWETVSAALEQVDDYVICANKNCPRQTVIAGSSAGVDKAVELLTAQGLQCIYLPVSAAFHSEIVAPASKPLRNVLGRLDVKAPKVRVLSNVGAAPYPDDPEAIRDNLATQVASAVEWIGIMERMYDEGVRTFIEVGPKKALTGFCMDIFKDKMMAPGPDMPVAICANHPKKGEIQHVNELFAFLGAWGYQPKMPELGDAAMYTATFRDPKAAFTTASPAAPAPATTDALTAIMARLDALEAKAGAAATPSPAPAPTPVQTPTVASVPRTVAHPDSIGITGISVGLPGKNKPFFAEDNWDRILRGDNLIDVLDTGDRQAMVDKAITRLVKSASGQGTFERIDDSDQVIKLAGRRGSFDLAEWGVSAELAEVLDVTSQYAVAAALEALRDAGIPLQRTYKTTSTGSQLPQGWALPKEVGDETGIIFASAFPGYDALLKNIKAEGQDAAFNRKFLFHVLSMGHAQVAQFLGARGPNTQVNAACASTTQAIAIAEDWIKAGRCKRVLVLGADDATSPELMEWIGSGFLASGAATTEEDVTQAALPFDARRHGMIIGMGAVGLVVEADSETTARGMKPIARLLATEVCNSAFHGSRLDVDHIAATMQKLVGKTGLTPADVAAKTVFMSHETYTPARGGSASAEIHALRAAFGTGANRVVVANTKGFTGHPQGAGIEDAVVLKALQRGTVPAIPNLQQPDPELGDLNLSKGGAYDVQYALRLAAGFGSQVAMTFTQLVAKENERVADQTTYDAWLNRVAGSSQLETVNRTLRVMDSGAPASSPAPEPVAAEPAPTATPTTSDALAKVTAVIAEKTGYPVEMLEPDLDMEADLGIDTVKQAELFGELREMFGVPFDESLKLSEFNTLRKVAAYMGGGDAGTAAPASTSEAQAELVPDPIASPDPTTDGAEAPSDALERVTAVIAEKTGYPVEMLEPDLDMEADLGIDTVKQAELFGELREMFGVPFDENLSLAEFNTLRKVAAYMGGGSAQSVEAPSGASTHVDVAPQAKTSPEPTPDAPAASGDALAKVTEVIAEKTGYPIDMLEPDLDMEADLGIDTVKQAELFGELREHFGVPFDESLSLADYNTLRKVAAYMSGGDAGTAAPASTSEAQAELVPETNAVPAPQPPASDDSLTTVTQVVADKTGYPAEMLEPDLDLEADLGIDTVKQAELFGELREHFGVPFDESLSLADYNTLRKVAQYMGQGAAQAAPAAVVETAEAPKVDAMTAPILRRIPTLRPAPSPNANNDLPTGRVVVVGAEDGVPVGALAEHGWSVDGDDSPVGILALDLKPRDGGVVGDLFEAAKAHPNVSFVLVATKQDGAHGLEAPRDAHMAALAGLGKSLKKEFPDAVVKVVDLDPDLPVTLAVAELVSGGTRTEVCYDAEATRFEIDVAPETLEGTPDVANKTLVVSGGAQGITVELLAALAPQAPNLILLGRTQVPEEAETWATWTDADWKAAEQERMAAMKEAGEKVTPVSLQKAMSPMQKAAEVRRNLDRLTDLGAEVLYCPVDVTDTEAVTAAIGHGRQRFGSIDGVIHAAGVEISKDLSSKDRAQFDLVYGIKHDGWEALMAATSDDRLEFLAAFGSVAGRFGNLGQTDYAAANEFLCKAVKTEAAARGVPTAFTIAWGPWGEVGMATKGSIMQIMEASGVTPIPTADGVRMFLAEMASPGVRECVVAGMVGAIDADGQVVEAAFDPRIGDLEHRMAATPERFRLLDGIESVSEHGLVARLSMDQNVDPYAGDHAIDGVPLLPGVFGLEAFAEATSLLADPGHVCLGAEDVRFALPLKQLKERPATGLVEVHHHGDAFACRLTSRMVGPDGVARGEPRVHFEATLKFGPAEAPITSKEVPETDGSRDKDSIYPPFFHGPSFQVLRSAGPLGDESVGTGQLPYAAAFAAGEPDFHTHPLVIEALFQVCGLRTMAAEQTMSLPAGIDQVDILSHEPPKEDYRLWCRYNGQEDGLHRFDAVAATASGRVLVRLVGYSMVPTGPMPEATVEVQPKAQVQQTLAEPAPEPAVERTEIPMAPVDLPEIDGVTFAAVTTDTDDAAWFTDAERGQEFAAEKRRTEWRAGRLAAKAAAMQLDDSLAATDVTVVNQDSGRPVLHIRGEPVDVTLSLTHRDGLAIAAISQDPLGIDLEVVEERPETWLHESFNEAEQPLAASAMGATCLWAAKEAAFKRIGDGLKQALHAWTVQPDGQGGATIAGPDATFGVRFFDVDGRVLAVTSPACDLTVDA